MRSTSTKLFSFLAVALVSISTTASSLKTVKVSDSVYSLVGPFEQRSPENYGNNATFGFVITSEGVVLVDSGGTEIGAAEIESAISKVTQLPITKVINTGAQDHRWFGNSYFAKSGATVIASSDSVAGQKARQAQQMSVMQMLVKASYQGTDPVTASEVITEETLMSYGGVEFELIPVGPAHTEGEMLVYLPDQQIIFSGDTVYVGRMLGIMDHSKHLAWIEAFEKIIALEPKVIIPGHGAPTTLQQAKADTYDYLTFLRAEVGKILEEGGDMQSTSVIDQSKFSYLEVYAQLQGANAQRVFEEMEWE